MRYPALNDLIERTNNKYSLVIIAAKRARNIVEKDLFIEGQIRNPVTLATREIAEDRLKFHYK
ncbi:DNA-directed RNA polymerase subunit omega [Alkalibacter saccharofermentans]|jgi:DNA-directed RNA polymerase subunit omega|uniref:DNA-directed RNA polymerase subunit omega n=1 Tax=Alkalibacter saccharofermentans DSM 14828 TaxID=1120975 RepID=A0A1M4S4X1_9FIRM|nr:DNA-directed RNA polymerase subunit omega [Alkalibacter saccharofermentans]SHE27245.1 DNA-directed RNA polymerase subunit omega [Alkalibacter saccharofermentans DSM 14828]